MKLKYYILLLLIVTIFISGCIQQRTITPSDIGEEQITQIIPDDFPLEYINKSRDYLTSKFGENLFESSIQFNRAYIMEFSSWGGCNEEIEPIGDGKKYIVEYKLNLSKYVTLPPKEFYSDNSGGTPINILENGYEVKVVYNHLGKIDCTDKVVDCVNHPEYCPLYKINRYESAIESFNEMCNRKFTRVNFEIYSNYNNLGYIEANESRFLWYFDDLQCGRHCSSNWVVYIDPQTGKPIHDDYFADRNYYCDRNGKCEVLTSTARESGIDFRVCKEIY